MEIEALTKAYVEAEKTEDFSLHLAFVKMLLKSESLEVLEFHYALLENTSNAKLHQRVRAAFNKRQHAVDAFLLNKLDVDNNVQRLGDAIQILGHRRCVDALPRIRKFINRQEEWLRYNAMITLGWMGEPEDLHILGSMLTAESSDELRGYSATALRQMFFRDTTLREEILRYLVPAVDSEANENVLGVFLISAQDLVGKKFGLTEKAEQRVILGDVQSAKTKFLGAIG